MAEPLLVAAGHQAGPGGAAIRPADVAAGAADAVLGQRIEVRRGNVLAAVDADVGIAHVVADDDQDVGPGGQGTRHEQRRGQSHGKNCP